MFGLENRGETLIFMSRHFDETTTIMISHFLCFGALKFLTGDYFVLRINQMIYKKLHVLFIVFSQHFSYSRFFHSFCTGLRINGLWIELHISK